MNMDQAKAALGNVAEEHGEKGLEEAKKVLQEAMGKKEGGAEGGEGGNPLAGLVSTKLNNNQRVKLSRGDNANQQQKKDEHSRPDFIVVVA